MIFFVILQLALVVLAHELGHYFFARLAGVRVISFNIGFGLKLLSFKRGETIYALRCIPIGGYVQIADDQTVPQVPLSERYENKSWLARFGVVSGGTLGNFLFAWLIFYILPIWYKKTFITVAAGLYKSFLVLLQLLMDMLQGIISLFTQAGLEGLSGPIGIINTSFASTQNGAAFFLLFTAFLSVNLGMLNLLPFPGLDGGRLVFLLYELVFRRKPNPAVERWVHGIGLFILFWLLILVSWRDLLNLKQMI